MVNLLNELTENDVLKNWVVLGIVKMHKLSKGWAPYTAFASLFSLGGRHSDSLQ